MLRCRTSAALFGVFLLVACSADSTPVTEQKELARIVAAIPEPGEVADLPPETARQKKVDELFLDWRDLCDWEVSECREAARRCFRCIGDKGLSRECGGPCGAALGACEAAVACVDSVNKAMK